MSGVSSVAVEKMSRGDWIAVAASVVLSIAVVGGAQRYEKSLQDKYARPGVLAKIEAQIEAYGPLHSGQIVPWSAAHIAGSAQLPEILPIIDSADNGCPLVEIDWKTGGSMLMHICPKPAKTKVPKANPRALARD